MGADASRPSRGCPCQPQWCVVLDIRVVSEVLPTQFLKSG